MARSVLIIYEPLDTFKDKKSYWSSYISFYEDYWDEPSSPRAAWFGREYEDFREALSRHLEIDKEQIEDCFFIRDKDGTYYVSPLGSGINANILSSENFILPEWFFSVQRRREKSSLYSYWIWRHPL